MFALAFVISLPLIGCLLMKEWAWATLFLVLELVVAVTYGLNVL